MTDEYENKVIQKYNEAYEKYGLSDKSLGWFKGRSKLRFEILTEPWDLEGTRVLDFGCGFGDLFGFLKAKRIDVNYTGIDINENFIRAAKDKYVDEDFRRINILNEDFDEDFDYAFISGSFNDNFGDNLNFIKEVLRVLDRHTKKGIAFNCISNKVDYQEKHVYYADPAEILDISYNFSNCIVLKNDYMPFEFSIFIKKNTMVDKKMTVYDGFTKFVETK